MRHSLPLGGLVVRRRLAFYRGDGAFGEGSELATEWYRIHSVGFYAGCTLRLARGWMIFSGE